MVRRLSRLLIGVIGGLMVLVALGFAAQLSMMADVWPWSSYTVELEPLSFYFLSSIALAIAAPLIWIAATGSLHAAPAGALNLAVTFGGIAGFMFVSRGADPANERLLPAAGVMGLSALANLAVYFLTRRLPAVDPRPLPTPVRVSFAFFTVVLILVGGALVLGRPNILPWTVSHEGAVVYGWIFLGASVYFAYALAKPLWENAAGPLLGFLAYDLVLIAPFLAHFASVPAHLRLSLIVYTAVVVYSGLLAVYYLFLHRETRLVGRLR